MKGLSFSAFTKKLGMADRSTKAQLAALEGITLNTQRFVGLGVQGYKKAGRVCKNLISWVKSLLGSSCITYCAFKGWFLSEVDKHVGVLQSLCAMNRLGLVSKPGNLDNLLWVIMDSLLTCQLPRTFPKLTNSGCLEHHPTHRLNIKHMFCLSSLYLYSAQNMVKA